MKVVAPIKDVNEVIPVIRSGADEIYCGVLIRDKVQEQKSLSWLNRRSFLSANLGSFAQLESVVEQAHSHNVPVGFTINEFYSQNQFPSVMEQVDNALLCGVDSLIISDPGLLYNLKNKKLNKVKICLSSCSHVFNTECAKFYQNLGVSKIILPRQLRIPEITTIAKNIPNLEFEVFILRDKCPFIDGLCTFQHGLVDLYRPKLTTLLKNKILSRVASLLLRKIKRRLSEKYVLRREHACCMEYRIKTINADGRGNAGENVMRDYPCFFNPRKFLNSCGACAIYDFEKNGIHSIKIAGRDFEREDKAQGTYFIKESVKLLGKQLTREEYVQKVRLLYREIFRRSCSKELCYY